MLVTTAPHMLIQDDTRKIMWSVNMALVPAFLMSLYFFGLGAFLITITSIITCCLTEYLCCLIMKKENSIFDGSAVLTGILLAFNLPSNIPLWMVAIGGVVSIAVVKMLFGGLGCNIFNPALVGRAFLLACYPVAMTTWPIPRAMAGITGPTPLGIVKEKLTVALPGYWDLFIGNHGGSLGETSALFLLLGGAFLLFRKIITWHIPVSFIGTAALLFWIFGGKGWFNGDPLFAILTGGIMLGAIFMATDLVTSPLTKKGQLIFGCGIGVLTCLIRLKGGYPEGVSYSILIMNTTVPLIDRYIK